VPFADRLLYRIAHSFSLCELSTEGHCLGSGQLFLEIEVLYSQKTRRPPCDTSDVAQGWLLGIAKLQHDICDGDASRRSLVAPTPAR
jgi:hypothetical protein